ncbi:hypothetical protein [Methylococcus capsulatus]|uniref:Lipoprotein n=1 Tax=Methylococcus capsulatus TaxID=414 RepID=A0AA35UTJ9_METCP|nr:hypothetical protein [Methylococcus capsulatus]CAI8770140.1 conserved exported protein of unknown function [Methylococcus capsulatus]
MTVIERLKSNWKDKRNLCLAFALLTLASPPCLADPTDRETSLPAALNGELDYLLGFVGKNRLDPHRFDAARIGRLLDFVASPKDEARLYRAGERNGAASAYYESDLRRSLDHLLRLTYSNDIPSVFSAPSTVRTERWTTVDAPGQRLPELWAQPTAPDKPVVVTGMEHLVNSPDSHSGAYYEYDLYRTLLLTRVGGRKLLISLSSQTGESRVGRKGIIVGPDDNWDYLYTDQTGLNRTGLGWASTYMYGSQSVAFYLETETSPPKTRFGAFKWIRAGWAGINVVNSQHIFSGLRRFGDVFKRIAEHPRTDDTAVLARNFRAVARLPQSRLKRLTQDYLAGLRKRCEEEGLLADGEVQALFRDGHYLDSLSREDMESILAIEYAKQILGKPHYVELADEFVQME